MKGVVFNIVEEVVSAQLSVSAWDGIVRAAAVDGAYTSSGTYADDELTRIVAATAQATGTTSDDVLRFVGLHGFELLADRVPEVMQQMRQWADVLVELDAIIHAEVRKLYPGAMVPGFLATVQPDGVLLRYTSTRSLCALADGLAVGAGRWFGRSLVVQHVACTRRGDADCVLLVQEREHQ
jgi:hypothetical protein